MLTSSIIKDMERLCRSFFWGQKKEEKKISWVAWRTLCKTKKQGGLGFRNLKCFNLALLAKQAWRILTNENSLMTKVLKGKYFPNTSFLEAKIKSNVSYTWRSILSAKHILQKGLKRIIGNGSTMIVENDPWLPSLPRKNATPREQEDGYKPYVVAELIDGVRWKRSMVSTFFAQEEANAIYDIPLPRYLEEDSWSWSHSKDGFYSVRSAYILSL